MPVKLTIIKLLFTLTHYESVNRYFPAGISKRMYPSFLPVSFTCSTFTCTAFPLSSGNRTVAVQFGGTVTFNSVFPPSRFQDDSINPTGELNEAFALDICTSVSFGTRTINFLNPGTSGSLRIPATPSIYHAPG